jgi:diacylglycerol kinase
MDFTHQEYAVQVRSSALLNALSAIRKICSCDPGIVIQLILIIPVIAGGIVLHMNTVQWLLISFVTLIFIIAGFCRTAALLQISNDPSLTSFQVTRIRCMGDAIVAVTAGISLITYLLVFVPKITQLI